MVALAEPAPKKTTLAFFQSFPASLIALIMPARVTQAVPWASSCQTGIPQSCSSSSTLKQLGWEMSSRFTAPKDGVAMRTKSMIFCGSCSCLPMAWKSKPALWQPGSVWLLMQSAIASIPPR